jgi:hypothetical protein
VREEQTRERYPFSDAVNRQADDGALRADLDAALKFLDAWHGIEPRHLTAIVPDGKTTGKTFFADQREQLRSWITEQQRRGTNVYYHVNILHGSPRRGGKATKTEVSHARGAHVEIDLKDEYPNLDWRDDDAIGKAVAVTLERVTSFPINPTFVILSGGGVQAGWRFDQPLELNEKTTPRVEALNLALAIHLGGDRGVRDTARILRVPGTINFPNEKKRKLGRVTSFSSCPILFDNAVNPKKLWDTVPAEAQTQANAVTATKRPASPSSLSRPLPRSGYDSADAWINALDDTTLHTASSAVAVDADRSAICFSLELRLIAKSVPDDVTVELWRRYPDGPLGHFATEKQLREDLARARQRARQHGFDGPAIGSPQIAPGEPAIPAIVEPRPGDDFPVDELGPRLARVARMTTRATGVPVGLAAMTVLSTCSLMAQQHVDVEAFGNVRPISLMTLVIAASGERKTSVDDRLLKRVRKYERGEVMRLEAEKQKHRIVQQVFEAQVKAIARKTCLPLAYKII